MRFEMNISNHFESSWWTQNIVLWSPNC